jgi:ParB family chromosome partitioning protein
MNNEVNGEIQTIEIDLLYISDFNVRLNSAHDEEKGDDHESTIEGLVENIRANGLLNPLTVRPRGDRFEIIAGGRRFRAIKRLGWRVVDCKAIDCDDIKAEEISLSENLQRKEMKIIEKIRSYRRLLNLYGGDINKLANDLGVSVSTIRRYVKIGDLPDDVLALLDAEDESRMTLKVAYDLARLTEEQFLNIKSKIKKAKDNKKRKEIIEKEIRCSENKDEKKEEKKKEPVTFYYKIGEGEPIRITGKKEKGVKKILREEIEKQQE